MKRISFLLIFLLGISIPFVMAGFPSVVINGEQSISGSFSAAGDLTIGGNLDVALDAAIGGDTTLTGDLIVDGGDIGLTADTDLIQIAADAVTINGVTTNTGDIRVDGGEIGITADVDLISLAANVLTVNGGVTMTADLLVDGTDIGITADADLIKLAADLFTINGGVTMTADLLVDGTDIGITADPDLIKLASDLLTVNGGVTTTGSILVNGGDIGITADSDLLQLASGDLTINGICEFNGNISLEHPGVSSDSRKIFFYADTAAQSEIGSIYVAFDVGVGLPGLVISVPHISTGVETPVFAILSTIFGFAIDGTVDIGQTGAFRPKDIFTTGNINAESGNISASGDVTAGDDMFINGGNLGLTADPNLIGLAADAVTMNGSLDIAIGGITVQRSATPGDSDKIQCVANDSSDDYIGGIYTDVDAPALVLGAPDSETGVWTDALSVTDGAIISAFSSVDIGVTGDDDLMNLSANVLTVNGGVTASLDLIVDGGDIGLTADTDLIQIAAASVTVNGDFYLGVPVYEDIRVNLTQAQLGPANNPGFDVFQSAVRAYHFDPDADEELFFNVQIPHGYKYGTDLEPHIHWTPTTTNTAAVRWCLEYTLAELDGTFGASTTICVADDGDGTAYKHQIADLGNIDGSAIDTLSAVLVCRIYRDADDGTDLYTGDAAGLDVDFHYQVDTIGSAGEFTK